MDREEVLAKSRAENRNKDVCVLAVERQAGALAVAVQSALAAVFFLAQICAGGGVNWGLWALVLSAGMTVNWAKYRTFRRARELAIAVAYTVLVAVMSACHVCGLLFPAAL